MARTAGILLCVAFLVGSVYLPSDWSQENPRLAMSLLGIGISCAVALFFILGAAVWRGRRRDE